MERWTTRQTRRRVTAAVAGLSLGLVTGCSTGSHEIPADTPVSVLDKYTRTRYITAQESGGFPHYEEDHYFIVEQCENVEPEIVEEDGCVELTTKVSETTYEDFDVGDVIVYQTPRRAYPVSE